MQRDTDDGEVVPSGVDAGADVVGEPADRQARSGAAEDTVLRDDRPVLDRASGERAWSDRTSSGHWSSGHPSSGHPSSGRPSPRAEWDLDALGDTVVVPRAHPPGAHLPVQRNRADPPPDGRRREDTDAGNGPDDPGAGRRIGGTVVGRRIEGTVGGRRTDGTVLGDRPDDTVVGSRTDGRVVEHGPGGAVEGEGPDDTVVRSRPDRSDPGSRSPEPADGGGTDHPVTASRPGQRVSRLQAAVPRQDPAGPRARVPSVRVGGRVVRLDRPVVVGRRPTPPRVPVGPGPELVTVPSPSGQVSSSHVAFHAEGEAVVVEDLRSTNGTVVRPAGAAASRMPAGASIVVLTGTLVEIGDGNVIEVLSPHLRAGSSDRLPPVPSAPVTG